MIHVHLLPDLVAAEQLRHHTVVVIDVLRATTTICYALAAGATRIIPVQEIDEARQAAELELSKPKAERVLLGGERKAVRIEGFDLGNSPAEYTSNRVQNATIVFTTSNGTKAMRRCHLAQRVLLASFANLSAVCDQLVDLSELHIVCAGTDNEITREDALLAGAIVHQLTMGSPVVFLNDQAELVAEAWSDVVKELTRRDFLSGALRSSRGARNLIEAGLESDIDLCAQIDQLEVVPELRAGVIRL